MERFFLCRVWAWRVRTRLFSFFVLLLHKRGEAHNCMNWRKRNSEQKVGEDWVFAGWAKGVYSLFFRIRSTRRSVLAAAFVCVVCSLMMMH